MRDDRRLAPSCLYLDHHLLTQTRGLGTEIQISQFKFSKLTLEIPSVSSSSSFFFFWRVCVCERERNSSELLVDRNPSDLTVVASFFLLAMPVYHGDGLTTFEDTEKESEYGFIRKVLLNPLWCIIISSLFFSGFISICLTECIKRSCF